MKNLFRATAAVKSSCMSMVLYLELMEKVRSGHDAGRVTSQQLARYFLFYLLSVVILMNTSSTGFLQLLPVCRNLRDLSKYSWGTAAFAHMYTSLDTACRGGSWICSIMFALDVSVIHYFFDYFIFKRSDSFLLGRFEVMSLGCFLIPLLRFESGLSRLP